MTSTSNPMPRNRAVIIGGSISGLMHGIMLKHCGYHVHILEQNTQVERADLAAGITTHPEFEEFMTKYDQTGEPWSIQSPGIQFLNKDSTVKRRINKALKMTSWSVLYRHLRAILDEGNSRHIRTTFDGNGALRPKLVDDVIFDRGKLVTGLSLVNSNDDSEVEITYDDLLGVDGQKGSLKADLVVVANGHNSKIRNDLFPSVQRTYAGYVAFRGTVSESDVSEQSKKIFDPNLTYHTFRNGYILLYIIPGTDGSLEVGHRRYNWVWYHPLAADSPAFTEIMTDTAGNVHHNTLPIGTMQPTAWAPYVSLATEVMCEPFAEMIQKTTQPFVTAINDVSCPRAVAFDGKVFIVGEALNLMRPHMALSTTQGAVHALEFERFLDGEIELEEWEKRVLHWGRVSALKTNAFGTLWLYGSFTAALWALKLASVLIGSAWPFSGFSQFGGTESKKTQ